MIVTAIDDESKLGRTSLQIGRRVYCTDAPKALSNNENILFDILNKVSEFHGVPINSILISGSAQSGYSFHQQRPFVPGQSDLDIAIVDQRLFVEYLLAVRDVAVRADQERPIANKDVFPQSRGVSSYSTYLEKVGFVGAIFPQYLPDCETKAKHYGFYRAISRMYKAHFDSISSVIFLSFDFFERQQAHNIEQYQSARRAAIGSGA